MLVLRLPPLEEDVGSVDRGVEAGEDVAGDTDDVPPIAASGS